MTLGYTKPGQGLSPLLPDDGRRAHIAGRAPARLWVMLESGSFVTASSRMSCAMADAPSSFPIGFSGVLIECIYKPMSLYIRSEEADRLARQLAERTGESLTQTVTIALRERLERTPSKSADLEERLGRIREIQRRVAASPVLQTGSDDELLYGADGLPK